MKYLCLTLLFALTTIVTAQLKLPTFFADNMVLQQNTSNAIWGWSEANAHVSIRTSWGEQRKVVSDKNGYWKAIVPTPSYRRGQSLIISAGTEEVEIKNVSIGEVWLCLGQSNMGWALKNCFNTNEELKKANVADLHIYKSDRQHWHEPRNDCATGRWRQSNSISAGNTSAVAWHFGATLQRELGIPVGIIVQAYAGTPVEGWIPWQDQEDIERSQYHKQTMDDVLNRQLGKLNMSTESAMEKYKSELAEYHQRMASGDTMKSKNKRLMAPIITRPANLGNQYPAHIYNAMVHPLLGYGIKGIIWYQGERNSKTVQQAIAFKEQLNRLIDTYRKLWFEYSDGHVNDDLYFSLTQLPSWGPEQSQPVEGVESPWAVSRQIMLELQNELDNVGLAVSIDTGSPVELHPKNKKPIGLRHAYGILHDVYKKNRVGHGPYFTSFTRNENTIVLSFDGVGNGLKSANGEALNSFAIAGMDKRWYWAKAKIKDEKVIVSSKDVPNPVAVRYAWAMNPSQRNLLYNTEGFPASPFRTDDWGLFESDAEEITVNKPKKPKGYVSKDWWRPAMTP